MFRNVFTCRAGIVKVCGASEHGVPLRHRYVAVTVASESADPLKIQTSEWKNVGGTPWSEAIAGSVT